MTTTRPAPTDREGALKSPNFGFLAKHHELLVRHAARAERYLFDDPATSIIKVRQFAELLAQQVCAYVNLTTTNEDDFVRVHATLRDGRVRASCFHLDLVL